MRTPFVSILVFLTGCGSGTPELRVDRSDVERFQIALSEFHETGECSAFDLYTEGDGPGVELYRKLSRLSSESLCTAVRDDPERYEVERWNRVLASLDGAIDEAFARLKKVYPGAEPAPIVLTVGVGRSAGTTTKRGGPAVILGVERMESVDQIVRTSIHELVHLQQRHPFVGSLTGGPSFLRGSLLRVSIVEGAAEFLTDLALGEGDSSARERWAEPRERELWAEFQAVMYEKRFSGWVYGGSPEGRPNDLGYYLGQRIVSSYYENSSDGDVAIREILNIRDFEDFLRRSGYAGGS